jgi:hypothetical protein
MQAPSFLRFLVVAVVAGLTQAAPAATQRETGYVSITQNSSTIWKKVDFSNPFAATPVVVAGPASYNDTARTTVRVRNVNTKSFEIQLDEWDNLDGAHAAELVSWMAFEAGIHDIAGKKWEAGIRSGVITAAINVNLANPYTTAPIALASVVSATNARAIIPRLNPGGARDALSGANPRAGELHRRAHQ